MTSSSDDHPEEVAVEDGDSSPAPTASGPRLVWIAPLVPLFMVALFAARPIKDNSFLWHIRAGDAQSTVGEVLSSDIFSFTRFGAEWRTQSWLVELMYAWLEDSFGGLTWANWMVFLVASATVGFIGLSVYRSTRSPISTGFVLIVGAWLMGPFTQPRPVLFSYALAALLVVVVQNRDRLAWAVVPVIWLWAGVHGSWVLGGLLVLLEWLRTKDRRLFWAGAVSAVATLATAHGLGTWKIVLSFLESREALDLIEEWAAPEFLDIVQAPYLLLIAGVIIAAIRGKISLRDLIVILPFMFFGMSSRRAVFPAAIVLIPWAALAIPPIPVSKTRTSPIVVGTACALVFVVGLLPMVTRPLGELDQERFPSETISEALGEDRAFHGDAEGGYLIYAEWPDRLIYIDDRAELYGTELFEEYRDIRGGDYREAFDRWEITAVMAQNGWPLTDVLTEDGWTIRESDEHFTVFGRP